MSDSVLWSSRTRDGRKVARDNGGVYDAETGYYLEGHYTPRTYAGASDEILMPGGGWDPDRPMLCLTCADQLIMVCVGEGRGCCMGCMEWESRHASVPDCGQDAAVRIHVQHYDAVKHAILTDTYWSYDDETGVRTHQPGWLPTVDEQREMVRAYLPELRRGCVLDERPVLGDPGNPHWQVRRTDEDATTATFHLRVDLRRGHVVFHFPRNS